MSKLVSGYLVALSDDTTSAALLVLIFVTDRFV